MHMSVEAKKTQVLLESPSEHHREDCPAHALVPPEKLVSKPHRPEEIRGEGGGIILQPEQ